MTIMKVPFVESLKEPLIKLLRDSKKIKENKHKKVFFPMDAIMHLEYLYNDGYGLKSLARELGISYSEIRRLFKVCKLPIRNGTNVVTDKLKEFRSEKAKANNPWTNWPTNKPEMHKSTSRGKQGYYKRKDGNLVWLRSTWEYIFAKWLDSKNIKWSVENKVYKLINGENYTPDFFIYDDLRDIKKIIEVKGYFKNRAYKVELFKRSFPDIPIIMIDKITPFTDNYTKEYKLWEIERNDNRKNENKEN